MLMEADMSSLKFESLNFIIGNKDAQLLSLMQQAHFFWRGRGDIC